MEAAWAAQPRWLAGVGQKGRLLSTCDKAKGALLDRFGVFDLQWANSKWCDVFLDDLTYTVSLGAP